jgi:cytoskeletal protein CcmA (bactofilin family)
MFKSNNRKEREEVFSNEMNHVAASTKIVGNLISKGNIRFDGDIEGNLISEAKIVLGETAIVNGLLKSQSADISGKVIGLVEVSEELILRKKAIIEADIATSAIIMESGAVFNGSTIMNSKIKSPSVNGVQEKTI